MLHLDKKVLPFLEQKNLLAFSAGVDSTALFFLLLHHNIDFDIALVNYGTRESSEQEEAYAKELAQKYHKKCYTTQAPHIEQNFEKEARDFRYDFFEKLIKEHGYQ
ncbi:MAG: ATP-binding protein, partial [Campylobacterota bacterium]|nr:ATP-binding protein [Campylobacterota bacterium]